MKATLVLLCCLLAFVHAGYVIQRLFAREDNNCERNSFPYGTFYQVNKCLEPNPGNNIIFSCNSTHTTQKASCNADCSNCEYSDSFPLRKCVDTNWARMMLNCVEKLPELEKTGIYMRYFPNEECKIKGGDYGFFIPKENCYGGVGRSSYLGYDDIKKVFKQLEYEKEKCQGNVVKAVEIKLEVCSRTPSQFAKLMSKKQPPPYVKVSKE